MFDVRTSAAMRQVADLSHQSILEQLELTDSDYAAMVKEQREMIKNLQDDKDRLEEEVRNLTNRYIEATLEGGKK
jgi:single-stranded DNA-specific DHH superfamily exonuclease